MRARTASAPAREASLWAGVLVGPLAWFTVLQLHYALAYVACRSGSELSLHVTTAVALLATALSGVAAAGVWRREREPSDVEPPATPRRRRFMAGLGILVSALFIVVIAAQAVPYALLEPCQ